MSSSVSIFGLGYVGSVTAGCLSHKGRSVVGVDVNPIKVDAFAAGRSPVLEPGLEELLAAGREQGRIEATTDTRQAIEQTDMSFICVGTPSLPNGKLDVSVVERVCEQIGEALRAKQRRHVVVLRSTVLPGTAEGVAAPALERTSGKQLDKDFGICSNPEFLREGSAIADFLAPGLTVIGGRHPEDLALLRGLYDWVPGEVFEADLPTAEMVKYVCNGFHALKISFANEIGTACKHLGVDAEEVMSIFVADRRLNISPAYLKPGFAFGGSCLPKDLRALGYRIKELDLELPLLGSILPSNERHLERAADMVLRLQRREVGLFGLSFKPGTDDLRESPHVQLVKRLLGEGCNVRIWDPNVALGRLIGSNRAYIEEYIPHIGSLLVDDPREVIERSEVLVLGTDSLDRELVTSCLSEGQAVVDLVHLHKAERVATAAYQGICW
jgi:GDP-mannose 6-dehydrogenase